MKGTSRSESVPTPVGLAPSGSRKKTQGGLTQQQEDEIVDMFKLFDVNRNNSVTKFELKEALWSLGQHPGEEEMDDIFREYDINRNGALDFDEFRSLLVAKLTYRNTREEFTEAFRAIDRNKDSKLDMVELKRVMGATGFSLTDGELDEIFGQFDKDGNGKVALEEFMDHMMGI